LILAAVLTATALHAAIVEPVRIDSGLISGVEGASPEIRAFKGIPYAAPPVGSLRWRAPQPAAKWDGVRKADQFAAACMQVATPRDGEPPFSEDCLYLNVWTAAQSASERRPVMMWIYGGGMQTGNSARASFYGDELAKKGVVLVTINYRVGLMGSYVHPEITKESGHNSSGNYAVLDMIAALQWIQRNIGGFGGDARNVTVFGQSSGAGSVSYLLGAPLAKGLFHRAICESSGGMQIGRRANTTLANAEKAGLQFAEKVGAQSLAELRAKPAAELIKTGWNVLHNLDSWVQPDNLDSIFAAGKQNDVPILAGSNSDEGATVVRTPIPAAKWAEQIKRTYGSMADGYLTLYPAGSDPQAEQSQRNEARDVRAWLARGLLRLQNKTGKSKTYSYFFSRNPAPLMRPRSFMSSIIWTLRSGLGKPGIAPSPT
jgi:para-nitrobenzyl esterase